MCWRSPGTRRGPARARRRRRVRQRAAPAAGPAARRVLRLAHARVAVGSRASLLSTCAAAPRAARALTVTRSPARGRVRRSLGVRRVRAGHVTRLRLPRLRPGRYRVRVAVLAGSGERPLAPRTLRLTVRRRPRAPSPRPRPAAGAAAGLADPPAVVSGGVFPVQGAHTFGDEDSRFGAGRVGHMHEGQDIAAAAGTPVVAPLAGQVLFNDYQAKRRGPLHRPPRRQRLGDVVRPPARGLGDARPGHARQRRPADRRSSARPAARPARTFTSSCGPTAGVRSRARARSTRCRSCAPGPAAERHPPRSHSRRSSA